MQAINVIGGGLAGCEAAYRIAQEGIKVKLWEMRPGQNTPVHRTANLAELVCSNSLKSELEQTSQGLLKREMRILDSLLLSCAEETRVPAGSALAVDRELFSNLVSERISGHPRIEVIREEVGEIPAEGIWVVATGPLTSEALSVSLAKFTGEDSLFFYDAVAPSVTIDSLDMNKIYRASRYGKGSDDYLNCPLNQEEYERFYDSLIKADIKEAHNIDRKHYFDSCMPVEEIASRGKDTLRYGPMRPVGLDDPRQGGRPYAVVQLRQEDLAGTIYGLVGFQTRLRWGEQKQIFQLIPGLENAEFVRYGVMHRNTYVNSPRLLGAGLQLRQEPRVFLAGQITGVEGYMESAATGIIAGINAARTARNSQVLVPDQATMLGALLHFITTSSSEHFQPINANFGLLPPLAKRIKDKQKRYLEYSNRALNEMQEFSELLQEHL
ncbi:MAG: methylenetetrahydrofolate--tRNA-(uracil(54)-C(5))-methyltransferase (FADH(2)-oxidizing) TrmFO [Syntrophomonadaceae bacterium]|nr:methylenetetrahydrofolate--tRNA-(uracil(54)-C(5))-methyltransferase (FADH(2)-oxidizing) TrmFO [Syntrophomonadaceae bacterium]